MRIILAMAAKDLRLLLRDKAGFFFTFFFPLLMAIFFGAIFAQGGGDGPKGMKLVVVDLDRTPASAEFVQTLEQAPEFAVSHAPTIEEGEALVRSGAQVACVSITPGFGEASERMFWGDPARLEVAVDPSRKAEAGMLQGILTKYAFQRMQKAFADPTFGQKSARDALAAIDSDATPPETRRVLEPFLKSLDQFMGRLPEIQKADGAGASGSPMANWQPVVIETRDVARPPSGGPTNAYAVSFPQGIMWGLIGACASFGISLVVERTRGTLVRLRMAPVGFASVLAGKGLACFIVTVAVATALLLIARFVFGVVPQSLGLLVIAVVCAGVAFTGIMMLLACIGSSEGAASGIGWAVLLVLAMIGGAMVPLFLLPGWMQTLSNASPVKWALLAVEGALWRGFGPREMLLPCAVLLGVGAVGFLAGARLLPART